MACLLNKLIVTDLQSIVVLLSLLWFWFRTRHQVGVARIQQFLCNHASVAVLRALVWVLSSSAVVYTIMATERGYVSCGVLLFGRDSGWQLSFLGAEEEGNDSGYSFYS